MAAPPTYIIGIFQKLLLYNWPAPGIIAEYKAAREGLSQLFKLPKMPVESVSVEVVRTSIESLPEVITCAGAIKELPKSANKKTTLKRATTIISNLEFPKSGLNHLLT